MEEHQEEIYIIPHNYRDSGKILGIIEKQSLFVAALWLIPVSYLNFYLLPFSVDIKIFIQIIVVMPPTAIILTGLGGDTVLNFLRDVNRFYNNAKIYYFKK